MTELQDIEVLAEGLAFPEGPVVMPDGSLVVVEIGSGRVSRVDTDGSRSVLAEVGGGPNGAALGPDGALYLCNNGGMTPDSRATPSIQRLDPETGGFDILYADCDGSPFGAPNDLVFDPSGGFWFTDFGSGVIYYALPDGTSVTAAMTGLAAPNGVGLSPDASVLYWAQTHTRQVFRRRLGEPGTVVPTSGYDVRALVMGGSVDPWTLVVGLPGAQELDSLAVEADGAVCVGTLVESGVTVVQPDDGRAERYTLPERLADGAVTNLCFGGDDMQTAFVTLSMTGRLVSCRWPRPGLRLAFPAVG